MKKLILAVNHCHSNGIVHRDLKPENIMYVESPDPEHQELDDIKVIDFGLSKILKNPFEGHMKTLVGTPYYVAPEVLDGYYGTEGDCWSLGVILYSLLSGCLPFFGENPFEVFDKIRAATVNFDLNEFKRISSSAKDLIQRLLTKDMT
jgi:serine/threonine protein kinase